jgi:twinkle protein
MTEVMAWLRDSRKLQDDLLLAMGVKQVAHPSLGQVAAFPYRRNGESYAAKFRTIDKRFSATKGVTRGLYNEDDLRRLPALPIVIVEGEIDCLSVMQSGFERAVSVPDGWKAEGAVRDCLVAVEADLRNSPYVIVAGDNDEAGESLPRAVTALLKGHDVRSVRWPDGCKDANDVLVRHGEGALAACLNAAVRVDPPGGTITGFSDLPPLGDRRVLRTGIFPFDYAIAMEIGAMSVWTGSPGSGKSTFLIWAAEKISVTENVRVGMLSFETHPHDMRDQLALIRTGRDFKSLETPARQKLVEHLDLKFRLVHATLDDTQQHLGWLEAMIHTLAVRDRCKLIVIDPWNELEHLPNAGETMTTYINFATKFIRQMAERLDIHIALVAHPRKMPTEGKPRPATGYDIADSAAFFNKPSLGVTVFPNQKKNEDGTTDEWVELHVWKVRKTRLYGFKKGKVMCQYDAETQSYKRRVKADD